MKIGILSDLHVDLNFRKEKNLILDLCNNIINYKVDLMLIAGDIANDYQFSLEILKKMEYMTGVKCLFVPGNHDLWNVKHQDKNAWDIYNALQAFPGNLSREPYMINEDWVVIGDAGWYDYSFGSPEFDLEEFDRMESNERIWMDKIFVQWDRPTREIHHYFYRKLEQLLQRYANKKIIFMTHVVPHEDFTVKYYPQMWDYFNGFLGSKDYGELVLNSGVKYAIFGHIHHRKEKQIGDTTFICNSLGYTREWRHSADAYLEIYRSFKTINI